MSKEKTNREKNKEDQNYRVYRGSSWGYYAGFTRVSLRDRNFASRRDHDLGFRLVFQTREKK